MLAAHEALANGAHHACPGGTATAWFVVERRGPDVVAVVRDDRRWQPPAADPGWRGHGMVLIHGLADDVDVRRGPAGTTVEMRWHLTAPRP